MAKGIVRGYEWNELLDLCVFEGWGESFPSFDHYSDCFVQKQQYRASLSDRFW